MSFGDDLAAAIAASLGESSALSDRQATSCPPIGPGLVDLFCHSTRYSAPSSMLLYHYGCGAEIDFGWGCSYRCAQMILSGFPDAATRALADSTTFREMQRRLATHGLIETSDVGSNKWIDPAHVHVLLVDLVGADRYAGELEVFDFAVADQKLLCQRVVAKLCAHFDHGGLPVMLDDGSYSYCIAGVQLEAPPLLHCEKTDVVGEETFSGNAMLLRFDPHTLGASSLEEYRSTCSAVHGARWLPTHEVFKVATSPPKRWMVLWPTSTKDEVIMSSCGLLPQPPARRGSAEEAGFSAIDDESLAFFRKNGYLVFAKGTVPMDMLDAARASVDAAVAARSGCSCDASVFSLFTETALYPLITQLLGEGVDFRGWCQVASIECGNTDGVGPHIDFGHATKPCCAAPAGSHLDRFSLLLGIPFTAFPNRKEDGPCGQFGVFAGSHVRLAEVIEAHGGYDGLIGGGDLASQFKHAWWMTGPRHGGSWLPEYNDEECEARVTLKLELTQAFVAHFNTLHFAEANTNGAETRNVVYFRIQHPNAHTEYDKGAFVNLWRDYPRLGGTWAAV